VYLGIRKEPTVASPLKRSMLTNKNSNSFEKTIRIYKKNFFVCQWIFPPSWIFSVWQRGAGALRGEDLSWIQDTLRIKQVLQLLHGIHGRSVQFKGQECGFGDADAVFTGQGPAKGNDLTEKAFLGKSTLAALFLLVSIQHDIDMDIAIPGMAKSEDDQVQLYRQVFSKMHKFRDTTAGHNHVFADFVGAELEGGW